MKINDLKVGNVYRILRTNYYGDKEQFVGVYANKLNDGRARFFTTTGEIMLISSFEKATSARIPQESRDILIELANIAKEQCKVAKKVDMLKKQIMDFNNSTTDKLTKLHEISGYMGWDNFTGTLEKYLRNKYNNSDFYWCANQYCYSPGKETVTLTETRDVEKYASPENYPFLYREYDNNIFIDREYAPKQYDAIANRYAPSIISGMQNVASKVEIGLSIGDKQWLSAYRSYTFNCKDGPTKKNLDMIINSIEGK